MLIITHEVRGKPEPGKPPQAKLYSASGMAKLVRRLRALARLPSTFTLDACRSGVMTELEEADLTDGQGRALSAHKSRAYEGCAKRTMEHARAATPKGTRTDSPAPRAPRRTMEDQNSGMVRRLNFGMAQKNKTEQENNQAAAIRWAGWGARIRTWEWRNQNPLPYRLATPQRPRLHPRLGRRRDDSVEPTVDQCRRRVPRERLAALQAAPARALQAPRTRGYKTALPVGV